ncbi:hypothetical protein [Hyphomicrobium sp. DY-1]|uniref:hypothetical protein n=1 Tax=Hyphomicrobium sp. DY-1 TaxID=3075650 RepID=UPI0039C2B2A8
MPEILKGLALDCWYKVVIWIGGCLILAALFVDTKVLTNSQVLTLGAGLALIGLGEWKSMVHVHRFKPANAYTGPAGFFHWTERQPDVMAKLMLFAGYLCLAGFFVELIWMFVRV